MGSNGPSRRVRHALLVVAVLAVALLALPLLGGAAQLKLPKGVTAEDAKRMYAEQLDSQSSIVALTAGEISKIEIVDRSVTSTSAELEISATYANGLERSGVMKLFKGDDTWFFSSIARTGAEDVTSEIKKPDVGVVNTILAEQVEHASLTAKLVDGTYDTIEFAGPRVGYRSIEIPATFDGGDGVAAMPGSVTFIKKNKGGEPNWFITGFAQ